MNQFDFEYHYTNDERSQHEKAILALIDRIRETEMAKAPPSPTLRCSQNNVRWERPTPPVIESRPRRKSGELGQAILNTLFNAGRSGIGLQGIAEEINSTPGSVSGWIYNNKNRVPGLRKLSPGIYAYESSR